MRHHNAIANQPDKRGKYSNNPMLWGGLCSIAYVRYMQDKNNKWINSTSTYTECFENANDPFKGIRYLVEIREKWKKNVLIWKTKISMGQIVQLGQPCIQNPKIFRVNFFSFQFFSIRTRYWIYLQMCLFWNRTITKSQPKPMETLETHIKSKLN